jgi:dephospho-CoA kinase
MPSIGITGVLGSGKSLALEVLGKLGAETVQADRMGHEVLDDPEVKGKIVALLGDGVLDEEGKLDRTKIGQRVFADAETREAYNRSVHPALLARLRLWLDRPRERVAAVEAALIPEWGIEDWFDEVWCIACSDQTALSRWKGDTEKFWNIRRAQFAPERKQAKAERVIENERSKEELERRLGDEWEQFRRVYGGKGAGPQEKGSAGKHQGKPAG